MGREVSMAGFVEEVEDEYNIYDYYKIIKNSIKETCINTSLSLIRKDYVTYLELCQIYGEILDLSLLDNDNVSIYIEHNDGIGGDDDVKRLHSRIKELRHSKYKISQPSFRCSHDLKIIGRAVEDVYVYNGYIRLFNVISDENNVYHFDNGTISDGFGGKIFISKIFFKTIDILKYLLDLGINPKSKRVNKRAKKYLEDTQQLEVQDENSEQAIKRKSVDKNTNNTYSNTIPSYLDTNNEYYSSRLAICIDVWNYLFLDGNYDDKVSIIENIIRWNKKNNSPLELSDNLIKAIQSILNFDKNEDKGKHKKLTGYTPKIQKK